MTSDIARFIERLPRCLALVLRVETEGCDVGAGSAGRACEHCKQDKGPQNILLGQYKLSVLAVFLTVNRCRCAMPETASGYSASWV
jgi:hypothetical protein